MASATSFPSPIRIKPSDRDPLRNFKFVVDFVGVRNGDIAALLARSGFISISGMAMQTDMIPYREGGDNTITRKLPGQSDVGPLTLVGGIFAQNQNAGWEWFKQIFCIQWGEGNAAFDDDFRCDVIVRVLKHPVTKWTKGGVGDPDSTQSAGMATRFYNCWPGSVQFNDLNAGDNSIMISNMTLHHEGFDPRFGANAQNPTWSS
jgi:phage tail-like protein